MGNLKEVWISRYALSDGLRKVWATISEHGGASYKLRGNDLFSIYVSRSDWHDSFDDAVKKANQMRDKRISSLTRQIEKLQAIDFTQPPTA